MAIELSMYLRTGVYFTVYHVANNDLNNLFPNLGRLNIVHKRFTRKIILNLTQVSFRFNGTIFIVCYPLQCNIANVSMMFLKIQHRETNELIIQRI